MVQLSPATALPIVATRMIGPTVIANMMERQLREAGGWTCSWDSVVCLRHGGMRPDAQRDRWSRGCAITGWVACVATHVVAP